MSKRGGSVTKHCAYGMLVMLITVLQTALTEA